MLNYKEYGKKRTHENKEATAALIRRAQRIARNLYGQEEPTKGGADHDKK
jgi:hypothetical protein